MGEGVTKKLTKTGDNSTQTKPGTRNNPSKPESLTFTP